MTDEAILFSAKSIQKSFPGVRALKNGQLQLRRGEKHALIGENGAGKSTMMKIILGSYIPDSGTMEFKGHPHAPKSPGDALRLGISMIHQEISLVPSLSVSENIWIGREAQFGSPVFINKKAQEKATAEILKKLKLDIDPSTEVSKLSIAMMQLVEIARAVSYDSDIIIMDEPTSALTETEVDALFAIMNDLAAQGKAIVFISHKLDEVLHICDQVTVFRDGEYITSLPTEGTSKDELVRLMIGRELTNAYPKADVAIGETVFEVKNLSCTGVCKDVSFQVHRGEILGFAGLMGAGRTEIMELIFGIRKKETGQLLLNGKPIHIRNTTDAVANKLAMVTEDRLRSGIFHQLSVRTNMTIAFLRQITRFGFVQKRKENADINSMVKKLSIKLASAEGEVGSLSGGNQQKVIVAKWLLTEPELLILDEPTRGIDVGAKAEIYKLVGQLAAQGKAIIFISSELPEVMGVSDRILVVRDGQIAAEYMRDEFDQEQIMRSSFGVK